MALLIYFHIQNILKYKGCEELRTKPKSVFRRKYSLNGENQFLFFGNTYMSGVKLK